MKKETMQPSGNVIKYKQAYGIIETLAPLHVGATAGEETGNLNLIFRDQYTQTGIIPGSSIRGRLRADLRQSGSDEDANNFYGRAAGSETEEESKKNQNQKAAPLQFESRIKIEYASVVWLPVFAPGQPIVWVSCPRLLRRYQRIVGSVAKSEIKDSNGKSLEEIEVPEPYSSSKALEEKRVFFNFGFVNIENDLRGQDLSAWFPKIKMYGYKNGNELPALVVENKDMGIIHDMALYRQSRVRLDSEQKMVAPGAFFNVEALPEGTLLVFPAAIKPPANPNAPNTNWQPFPNQKTDGNIYLGGLESAGFGHCYMTVKESEDV